MPEASKHAGGPFLQLQLRDAVRDHAGWDRCRVLRDGLPELVVDVPEGGAYPRGPPGAGFPPSDTAQTSRPRAGRCYDTGTSG